MPDGVRMVGAGCFEKLLKVIGGLPCVTIEVALSNGNELLVKVVGLLVVDALTVAGSDCNSFGSPLWPPSCHLWCSSSRPCRLP
jgi:hypothetical protein